MAMFFEHWLEDDEYYAEHRSYDEAENAFWKLGNLYVLRHPSANTHIVKYELWLKPKQHVHTAQFTEQKPEPENVQLWVFNTLLRMKTLLPARIEILSLSLELAKKTLRVAKEASKHLEELSPTIE